MRILSLLAVALAGCYNPTINDCQFTCPDGVCPGDLTCRGGLCRVSVATESCPCPLPPEDCDLVPNASGLCLAACKTAMVDWSTAQAGCAATGQWQLAVLGTTLAAAENALQTPTSWIGLTRGSMVEEWAWIDGSGSIAPGSTSWSVSPGHLEAVNTCAALDNSTLYSDGCQTLHAYACTPK